VLQPVGLAARQRAIADAVMDALLRASVTTLDTRRAIAVPAIVLAARPAFVLAAIPAIVVAVPTCIPTPTVAVAARAVVATPAASVGTLVVVALAVDSAALPIGHAVDASTLLRRHHTIGTGTRLRTIDCPLALLKARGLAAGDLAVANAALDALLLVILALIDAPHRLGGCASGGEQARRQNRVWDSSEFGHRSLDLDSTADVPS